ncbi:MAG: hypothetical protein IT363_11890 [Methanoregulaceae archaeon]|nr:hypothetical protein [Methanoregulaceae archaeon]
MATPGNGKYRGIKLTPEAILIVEARLEQEWREQHRHGKLTRRGMAELLHLSEKTASRMLRGDRVDRATVKVAFQRLEIVWDEAFIEVEPVEPAETEHVPGREARQSRLVPMVAVVITIASAAYWGGSRLSAPNVQPTPTWRVEFFDRLAKGTEQYQKGDLQRAKSEFEAVLQLAQTHDDLSGKGEALRMLADIDLAQGRFHAARDGYAAALEAKEKTGQTSTYPPIQQALGVAELKLKNYSAAKAWMRKSIDGFIGVNDLSGTAMVQRDLGVLAAAQGDFEGALAWFASARSGFDRATNTGLLMDIRAQEALVHLRLGDIAKADQMLADCLEFWEREGYARWIARTKLQLSQVKQAKGLQAEALALMSEAASEFRKVGDPTGLAEAKALSESGT